MTSKPGRFTMSMDFELGWGVVETGHWRVRERAGVYERLRPVMREVLDELDALEIGLTWAAVGGMASPRGALEFDHLPPVLRTCSTRFVAEARESTRDGRDLVEMVCGARTPQDLGSHSFSHARFSAPEYDDDARQHDLVLAQAALAKWGPAPVSFVFPENDAPSLLPVAEAGLSHARLAPATGGRLTGRAGKLMAKLRTPPFAGPAPAPVGLRAETGTMFFHWPLEDRFGLRRRLAMRQSDRALTAAEQGGAVHFWLHPFNLAEIPGLKDRFFAMLRRVAEMRDRGAIHVATMADTPPAEAVPVT